MEVPSLRRRSGRAQAAAPRTRGPFLRGAPPSRWGTWRPLLGLAVAGIAALAVSCLLGENGWRTWRRLERQRAAAAEEVAQLSAHQTELQNRLAALHLDPAVLERVAREKYGMHRPDEQIIELVGDESLQGRLPVPPPPRREKLGAPKPSPKTGQTRSP